MEFTQPSSLSLTQEEVNRQHEALAEAGQRCREGKGPAFVETVTERWAGSKPLWPAPATGRTDLGMALGRQLVDRSIVLEVCRDFGLRHKPSDEIMAGGLEETDLDGASTMPDAPVQTSDDSSARIEAFDSVPKPRRFTLFGSR